MLVFVFIVAENNWQQFPQVRISNTVLIALAVNDKTIFSEVNNIINQTQSYSHFPPLHSTYLRVSNTPSRKPAGGNQHLNFGNFFTFRNILRYKYTTPKSPQNNRLELTAEHHTSCPSVVKIITK